MPKFGLVASIAPKTEAEAEAAAKVCGTEDASSKFVLVQAFASMRAGLVDLQGERLDEALVDISASLGASPAALQEQLDWFTATTVTDLASDPARTQQAVKALGVMVMWACIGTNQ